MAIDHPRRFPANVPAPVEVLASARVRASSRSLDRAPHFLLGWLADRAIQHAVPALVHVVGVSSGAPSSDSGFEFLKGRTGAALPRASSLGSGWTGPVCVNQCAPGTRGPAGVGGGSLLRRGAVRGAGLTAGRTSELRLARDRLGARVPAQALADLGVFHRASAVSGVRAASSPMSAGGRALLTGKGQTPFTLPPCTLSVPDRLPPARLLHIPLVPRAFRLHGSPGNRTLLFGLSRWQQPSLGISTTR